DLKSLTKIAVGRYPRLVLPIFAVCTVVYIVMISGMQSPASVRIPPFNRFMDFQPTLTGLISFSFFDVFFNFDGYRAYATPLWTMSGEFAGSFLIAAMVLLA